MARALISLDLTPRTPADRQKLARALRVLAAEDDQLEFRPGAAPGSTLIGGSSEGHLEHVILRLHREFEVEASVGRPRVVYLETLTQSAEASAKHARTAHGHGEYAHVCLRLRPAEAGTGCTFEDTTAGGTIPKHFMTSIEDGIKETMATGVLHGYPIVDVGVEVYDGSYHDTDSTDAAFKTAAASAFQAAAKKAEPVVLEPVMRVVVRTANTHAKAVLDGFLMRKGKIHTRTREPGQEAIAAHVPLSELFGFEAQLRAETRGQVSCSIEFACYEPVVHGPAGDDDRASHVGAPRRPTPDPRSDSASVPEPE